MFQPTISPLALFCSKYSVRLVQIYGSEVVWTPRFIQEVVGLILGYKERPVLSTLHFGSSSQVCVYQL